MDAQATVEENKGSEQPSRVRRILGCLLKAALIGLLLLVGTLYWLLGTTSGSAFALRQASSLLEGIVGLEVPLVDGSILYGMKTTAPIRVEVPEIVSVTADSLDLKYNVFDLLTRGALVIDHLIIPNLKVKLLIDIFEESEEEEEESPEDEAPFRLNIPVHIVLNNFKSRDFAFLFQVVDVMVDDLDLDLEVQGDYAGINRGMLDHLTVHLKDEIFDEEHPAAESRETAAASQRQESADLLRTSDEVLSAAEKTGQDSETVSSTAASASDSSSGEVLTFDGGNGQIEPIGDIELPLIASIKGLKVKHGRYYMSMVDTGIFNSTITAMWTDTHLLVPEIRVEHILGQGELRGKIDFRDYMYFDFDLNGAGQRNPYTKVNFGGALYGLAAQGKLTGNLTDLTLNLDVTAPQQLSTSVRLNCLSSQLPAELKVQTARFAYPLLSEELKALEKQGQAEVVEATEQNWQQGLTASAAEDTPAELSDYEPEWMKIDTSKPEWVTEQAVLSDFLLQASGSLEHGLNTELSGAVNGYGAENIRVKLSGLVTTEDTTLPTLEASGAYTGIPFDVRVENFKATYGEQVSVQGSLNGSSSNLKAVDALLTGPASLGTDFALRVVAAEEGTVALKLANTRAQCVLNQTEAVLKASSISGNLLPYLKVEDLSFEHRSNHVDVTGQISPDSDLKAVFALNNLSEFSPDCQGQLLGQLTVAGAVDAPYLTLTGKSELLQIKDFYVIKFMINSTLSVAEEKGNLVAMADTLMLGPDVDPLKQLGLELSGTLLKHRLSLNCLGKNSGLISLEGSYDKVKNVWSGALRDFYVTTQVTRPISLADPVDIELNVQTLDGNLSAFELIGEQIGSLKVDKTTFSKDSLKTRLSLTGLALPKWSEYLPKGFKITGGELTLESDVDINVGKPEFKSKLEVSRFGLVMPNMFLPFEKISMNAKCTEKLADASLQFALAREMGELALDAQIKEPLGAQQLSGKVKLDHLNLMVFSAFAGGFNQISGEANIDGTLGGVLRSPLFNGLVSVKGSAEPHYDIGRIDDFDFTLRSAGQQGHMEGKVRINEGDLRLNGDLNWSKGADGSIKIEAQDLPIFLLGYGVAHTTVDTKVDLGEVINIEGKVEIPHAMIKVKNLESSGVSTSKDEIIIDERGTEPLIQEAKRKPEAPLNSKIDLKLKMGQDVKVEAMGLKAKVIGGLEIKKQVNDKDVNAEGVIELDEGEADLYGHHFLVNRARSIFQGDITKPSLDCEIIADPSTLDEDVIAGIHVTGKADKPQIDLFSRPVMSRNEIMSYLLYGHGLEKNAGNADSSSAELLMALGLGATTGLVNQMAGAFGMHNVTVGSSGTGDESKVGIQGYLTKDIRVGYGYGLYNSVGEFSLRYEMMRKFYVEVVSSINQAVNFIYSFSF